jgi:4-aminobutyrate aminotransferase
VAPDTSEGDVNLSDARRDYLARHVGPVARQILDADDAAYLHQALSTPCLGALASAHASVITDADGRDLLDFHGNSVHHLGHAHPRVVDAIKQQLDRLAFCPRRFTNQPAVDLARRLAELTGGRLPRVLIAPAGTLAMGMAMKLARLATGRPGFLSMDGAFHGASLDAISIAGEAIFREGVGPFLPGCDRVPPPAASACRLGCSARCNLACASALEEAIARRDDLAAVIAEPVRCTTVDLPHADYWRRVRAACDRRGVLLVFDEIPTCLGRTGRHFAHEHFGVRPDLLVIGKSLGGGIFPLAALLAREDLNIAPHLAMGHYTHEKSPVGCAAALAALDVLRDEHLIERAERLGESWRAELRTRLGATGLVLDVRGLGLLVGVELRAPGAPGATARLAERVLYDCLGQGLSFKVSDARVLTLTPPLTVREDELARATGMLEAALRRAT